MVFHCPEFLKISISLYLNLLVSYFLQGISQSSFLACFFAVFNIWISESSVRGREMNWQGRLERRQQQQHQKQAQQRQQQELLSSLAYNKKRLRQRCAVGQKCYLAYLKSNCEMF